MLCFFLANPLFGQPLTELALTDAYQLLEKQYPDLQNAELLASIYQKEVERLDKDRLPALLLKADGRLQSESTSLDVADGMMLPIDIDQPLYAIKAYVEAQYTIMDGGLIDAQQKMKAVALKTDQQAVEVQRYGLRDRVLQLMVNIELLRAQTKLFKYSLDDLQARKEKLTAAVEHGTALESELSKIAVRELELKSQEESLNSRKIGMINTLSQLLGIAVEPEVVFYFPNLPNPNTISELERPEQQLFQYQRATILAKADLIASSQRPRLAAFAQAGFGYPNPVNIFDNGVAPFGIVGLQFSWPLADWKKSALDQEVLSLQAMKLENAEATFQFNIDSKKASYLSEVSRLQAQIKQGQQITQLQASILTQIAAQLDEGVITSAEYISQVNAELLARQNLVVHEINLLKVQLAFWNERGGKL